MLFMIKKFIRGGKLPAIEIKQTQITMNKSVYLGLSILDLSETVT